MKQISHYIAIKLYFIINVYEGVPKCHCSACLADLKFTPQTTVKKSTFTAQQERVSWVYRCQFIITKHKIVNTTKILPICPVTLYKLSHVVCSEKSPDSRETWLYKFVDIQHLNSGENKSAIMVNINLQFFCDDIIFYCANTCFTIFALGPSVLLKDRMNEARVVISLRRGKAILIRLDQTTEIILNPDTTNK